jgi:hypothetical protein
MRGPIEIYDDREHCFVAGEFRPVRELDSGARLGYFESLEYGNKLTIMVLYPDGTYSVAERLYGELAQGAIAYDVD